MPVTPVISINGYPLPAKIAGNVYHVVYKEGIVLTGDTVSLSISDPDGSFRRGFKLKAAVPVTLSIVSAGRTRVCGTFYIHTVKMHGDKSGGTDVTIDCTSIPVKPTCSVRTERKSRGSEKTTLKDLATKVAGESGLTLQYKPADNPKIGRADQHDESDLVHLGKHCSENDFSLKIKDNALWVLDHDQLEKQAPVGTLVIPTPGNAGGINGVGGITSWELTECTEDIYKAAEVKHKDHKTGKIVTGTVADPGNADLGITLRHKHNPHHEESTDLNDPATAEDVSD
jgi:phage protein D